jgi:hypothetical protein
MMTATWASRFDALHETAASAIGLSDFGGDEYHEGLRVLLESLDANSPLAAGPKMQAAENLVLGPLIARLHTQAQWRANPGYRTREIPRPLIVIGVPRTGTTALHNLLSLDPQFQGIEKWLCDAPLVRPPRDQWDAHPQYQACVTQTEQMFAIAPEVMQAHGVLADEVDECLVPMAQGFCCNLFPSQLDIPQYDAWFATNNETASFRRYKDVLRLIGMADDRPWLIKNPSHLFGVDAMLAVFPDACVVQTHRSPVSSLASLVNLLDNITHAYTGEGIDRERRLARETAFWAEAVRRTMGAQARHPDRFVNVFQQDIRRDPLGVVTAIYDKFGINLSPEATQRMESWAARNAEQGSTGHSYERMADEGPVREAFAEYMARFDFT